MGVKSDFPITGIKQIAGRKGAEENMCTKEKEEINYTKRKLQYLCS
jgi:hypothetical protein